MTTWLALVAEDEMSLIGQEADYISACLCCTTALSASRSLPNLTSQPPVLQLAD